MGTPAAAAQLLEQDLKPLLVAVGLQWMFGGLLRDARAVRLRGALTGIVTLDSLPARIRTNFSGKGRSSPSPKRWGRSPPALLMPGQTATKGKFPWLTRKDHRTVARTWIVIDPSETKPWLRRPISPNPAGVLSPRRLAVESHLGKLRRHHRRDRWGMAYRMGRMNSAV